MTARERIRSHMNRASCRRVKGVSASNRSRACYLMQQLRIADLLQVDKIGCELLLSPSSASGDIRRVAASVCVQVFGRWNAETIRALGQPASEKRQSRKSRSVVQRDGEKVAVFSQREATRLATFVLQTPQ